MSRLSALLASQHINLQTDDLRYDLLRLSMEARNLRLRPGELANMPVFASVGHARFDLSLTQLLRGRIVVQSGLAENVELHYVVDANGRDNLPRPSADSDEPNKPLSFLVAGLSVPGARVRYTNLAQQVDVVLPLSGEVAGNALTGRHQLHFNSAGGQVLVRNRAAAVDRISGVLDVGQDDLTVDRLQLETLGSRAELSGAVRDFDAPELALTLQASIDAARAAAFLDLRDAVAGTISVDAKVSGRLSAPAIDAHVSGSEVRLRSLGAARVEVRGTYDAAVQRTDVTSARLQAPWGRVTANGQLAQGEDGRSRLHAEISGVDVAAVMRGLHLGYAVDTRVDGTINADWPGLNYLETSGVGTATLTPPAAPQAIPVGGRLSAHGRGGTIVADLQHIGIAGTDLTGRIQLDHGRALQGQVQARVPDVAATANAVETFLGRVSGSLLPTSIAGEAVVDARLGGTIDAPTASATLTAPSLSVEAANGIALAAEVAVTSAALTIARAEANWEGAHAGLNGTVGLTGTRRLDLVLDANAEDLQALAKAANRPGVPISGAISARGTIGGTVERPLASATLRGADISAFEEQFGSLNADLALAGREITFTRFVIEKPQPDSLGRISATGSYNLDRKTYTLDLQSQNVRLLAFRLPGGQQIRGNVTLAGRAAGTVSSPSGTVTLVMDALEVDGLLARSTSPALTSPSPAQLGSIVIAATAGDRRATITASAERFKIDAKAVIGLAQPWPATGSVRASSLDLETLPLGLGASLAGHLSATVNATGNLADPDNLRAAASIESMTGSWNGLAFSVTSAGELRYANERLDIERLQLTAADTSLSVSGGLALTRRAAAGNLAIEARANLATLAPSLPSDIALAADGVVTVTGALRGTLQSITPDLEITVENGVLLSARLDPGVSRLQLRARIADGAGEIERLTSRWGSAIIEASGTIPLESVPTLPAEIARSDGPATFKVSVHDFNPAVIPGAPAGLSGRITVDIDASATRADLAALEGRIDTRQLELAFNQLTLTQREPSRIRIGSGTATVEHLALSGSAGTLVTSGTVGLAGERPVDLKVDGTFNLAALSAMSQAVRTDGTATWTLAAHGTVNAPELNGTLDLADATVASDELNIAAVDIDAHIDMTGDRLELTRLSGELNGGTLAGSGRLALAKGGISDVDLQLSAKDVAYDAPLDLRSRSDATIRLTRRGDELLVAGQVTITEAGLTADVNFDEGIFAAIKAPRTLDLTQARNPLLDQVRFNIDVDTATPVIIENNLARGEIDADLRVVGTPYEPGLTGRLTLAEGSQLTLNARRYQTERGLIAFVDERRITPSFDLMLSTKASDYDVRIAVTGSPGNTETSWTSDPSLPEPDIMALLLTGRTLDEMRGEESEVARAQALSYLTGRVGSKFGRGLERVTGISEVRIEPVLVANETDPTARLTVGQNLTDKMKLIYSTNLADSNDKIWVVEYDVTRRFQMRAVRDEEDDTYRGDFRHDIRFGGDPPPSRQARRRPTIARLTVTSDAPIAEAELRGSFKLKEGDAYEFFAARSGLERIETLLLESGYLQSRVRLDRRVENDKVDVTLRVTSGPRVDLQFDGATPSANVREDVRTAWHRGVFDRQRGNDSVQVLRQWLMDDNYLQAKIEYDVVDGTGERRVLFRIQAGPRSDRVVLAFEGASGIDPDQLNQIIDQQDLERQLFTDPEVVTSLLRRYYREQGFLSTEIAPPRYDFQGSTARVVVAVQEGPRFVIRHVTATGTTAYTAEEIAADLPVASGAPFLPAEAERAIERIRDLYWRKGYNDVRSEYSLVVDRTAGAVDVAFTVTEGRQSVIAEIAIEGHRRTTEHLVREQIELSPDQPLDLAVLARSRRNLYNTGAFSIADITREDLEGDQPAARGAVQTPQRHLDHQKPVRVNVSLREVEPVRLRYGLSYDTEGGLGGILDLSNHNSLGKARVVGAHVRYDSEVREGRIYVSQPSLRSTSRKTIASVYFREDLEPPTEQTDPFDISRSGAVIQQDVRFRKSYVWSYGYRYELATTVEPSLGAGVTETVRLSPFSNTLTRETRDEVLDASKGTFLSQAFAYSPGWLGSDRPYLKYYGQYFRYFPLRPAQRKPFSDEMLRSRLVFATGARVGLAHGLGGDVPTSERFYAGGSTTLRGFEQNVVGPIANNVPAGGNAVLVLNNELRFPLVSIVDGVLFVDVGNVFATIPDFSLTDLRESAGFGIRLRTRWVLLRGDYGFVLDRRDGERGSRFYFNIGQAF